MRFSRALVLAVTMLLAGGCQVLNRGPSATESAQGRIAWPKDGDLWVYDLPTGKQTKITNLPGGAAVTGASW